MTRFGFSQRSAGGEGHIEPVRTATLIVMKTYFKFACVYCGQHIECESGLSGRQIKCPACQNRIVIPSPEKGKPARKQPLTKFTWDTFVPLPGAAKAKEEQP